ncbi:hypothetical protein AT3G12833 [Arabidopsis thaliana]|uniref:Uncharacterized protein n=1 Tax=Arabidopsis thaliana TaxID=3702 RepID=A0A1I9LQT8_ARATH|nr:uncharacterized protein AT3G12833 [Arabidopsis thaliana]ANM64946.1 hypothetical protein AT3G12833 [Arabidopsis thaliana]|eukprot:NP_001326947.1 hypothetical protein AT3G12833 [Arabidopsis thaliana]
MYYQKQLKMLQQLGHYLLPQKIFSPSQPPPPWNAFCSAAAIDGANHLPFMFHLLKSPYPVISPSDC